MSLFYKSDPSSPLISFTAQCDNPSCPTPPFHDSVHPLHVEPNLEKMEQINRYISDVAAKKGFLQRDGGFMCDVCHKTNTRSNRPSWDAYFLGMAHMAATRATCNRKHVGAVIVREKNVLATGYNGSIAGLDDCDTAGHLMENGSCVRTVHAEQNALAQAAKNGTRVDEATIYVTALPCWLCTKLILNSGIVRIVYDEAYRPNPLVAKACADKGVNLVQVNPQRLP